jgi:hypothetical protein
LCDQTNDNKTVRGACGKYGSEERWIREFWLGNQSEKDHLKYVGTDGDVTKVDLQKYQHGDKRGLLWKQY